LKRLILGVISAVIAASFTIRIPDLNGGQNVYINQDMTDIPYGRTLAYVHLASGEFFKASLISEGYARVMTVEPSTTWAGYYEDLQKIAQKEQQIMESNSL
jgi:hypothetical protein